MLIRPRIPGSQPAREPAGRNNIFTEGSNSQSNINAQQLARAYVPIQSWSTPYSPQEALTRGTIFPELYRPYVCRD